MLRMHCSLGVKKALSDSSFSVLMLCGLCLVRFQSSCGLGVGRGRAAGVAAVVSV